MFADEAARERAWRQRREFVQSVMQYVPAKSFDEEHVRPYFHIALYSNGTKADSPLFSAAEYYLEHKKAHWPAPTGFLFSK